MRDTTARPNRTWVWSLAALMVAALISFSLPPQAASADKPLDVDCDHVARTLPVAAEIMRNLPGGAGNFDTLGELQAALIRNPALFEGLKAVTILASTSVGGPPIVFEGPRQFVSTLASCGLVPALIAEIRVDP